MHAVFAALAAHAAARPDVVAFRDGAGPDAPALTWAGLHDGVQRLAVALDGAPGVIALDLAGGLDFVVADLAVTLAGRTLVPVPFFFSPEQRANLLRDSGAGAVIGRRGAAPAPDTAALAHIDLAALPAGPVPARAYAGGARRVIYTSGSSGRPRGVVLGDRQLGASVAALARVVGAGPDDRHLSVLPLAQLLEQIAGVFLPILAGAEVVLAMPATQALLGGPVAGLTAAMAAARPTTSLLAPGLLGRWVADLAARGERAPDSLRFVAVGSAPTPPALLAAAEAAGIPVHEGYGLSECCAVVAMNRPGTAAAGSVGRVLDTVRVTIEDGEIVVEGPSVMEGYLGGPPAP
ncbi:MAG: AMP-binding protein, partial [Rhodobacteraceae bacterium]|nr:AMP-binding protein [Paracoccaceae bacterium]